jgi:hypothetical protein
MFGVLIRAASFIFEGRYRPIQKREFPLSCQNKDLENTSSQVVALIKISYSSDVRNKPLISSPPSGSNL